MSDDDQRLRMVGRTRKAARAFRSIARVLHIHRMMMLGDAEVMELLGIREKLERDFAALTLLEPEQPAFLDALSKLESAVVLLEQRAMKLDAAIPMGWFRGNFDSSKFSSEALADYAALIGRYAGEDPTRLDRAQLLLTRFMHGFLGGDTASLKDDNIRTLLAEALPPSQLDPHTRDAAAAFFKEATNRVTAFTSLRELTASSFFLDVRGYKLSLRQGVLDPSVMAAAIALNQTVTEAVNALARTEAQEGASLDEYMKVADAKIREVFKALRTDDSREVAEFEARLRKSAAPGKHSGALTVYARSRAREIYRGLALAMIVGGGVLLWFQLSHEQPLTLIPLSATEALCPYLVTATVVPPPPALPRLVIGRINKGKWAVLNAAQRAEVAQTFAATMKTKGILAATVMLEDQVVIQIERDTVLLVQ